MIAFLGASVLGLLCMVVGLALLIRTIDSGTWRPRNMISFMLPLAVVGLMYFRADRAIVDLFRSRSVFEGACEHTVTFVHLIMREDGSCEYEPGSFLDRNWCDGRWKRVGDQFLVQVHDVSSGSDLTMSLIRGTNSLQVMEPDSFGHGHVFVGEVDQLP